MTPVATELEIQVEEAENETDKDYSDILVGNTKSKFKIYILVQTLQAGPFSISSQSRSWHLSAKSEHPDIMNRAHNE